MITLSPKALERIEQFIESDPKRPSLFRVVVRGEDKDGYIYEFLLQREESLMPTDLAFGTGTFSTVIDEDSLGHLKGAFIDWEDSVEGSGFRVENPNKPLKIIQKPTFDLVKDFVENEINPANKITI